MLFEKAELLLDEEVSTSEILKFLDVKYETMEIVTMRTIQRWIKELNIECIKPMPSRQKDIRYRKSDVLKLEEAYRMNLMRKKNRNSDEELGESVLQDSEKFKREHTEYLSKMTDEDMEQVKIAEYFDVSNEVREKVKEEMIEMCFNKLFPDLYFDLEKLEEIISILKFEEMFTPKQIGRAYKEKDSKAYIKTRK